MFVMVRKKKTPGKYCCFFFHVRERLENFVVSYENLERTLKVKKNTGNYINGCCSLQKIYLFC